MHTDDTYERRLRSERSELLNIYAAVDGAASLLDFQLKLAAAIGSRESAAFRSKNTSAKEHLRLLRLLGDGLAWQLLHPYAIRQLAKNPAPPPALGSQGNGFRETLHAAREFAADGHLVLVSDLSHCLTIGDLVICDDRERPSIVECGGHEKFLHKGRKARQLKRAQAVIDLLTNNTAVFPGQDRATRTLELKTRSGDTWAVADRVVQAALRECSAAELASNSDLVFAVRADTDPTAIDAMRELTNHMVEPTFALYTRAFSNVPTPVSPPVLHGMFP